MSAWRKYYVFFARNTLQLYNKYLLNQVQLHCKSLLLTWGSHKSIFRHEGVLKIKCPRSFKNKIWSTFCLKLHRTSIHAKHSEFVFLQKLNIWWYLQYFQKCYTRMIYNPLYALYQAHRLRQRSHIKSSGRYTLLG